MKTRKVTIECDGVTLTHMPSADGTDYATVCGIDGTDEAVGQYTVETPKGAKIDCPACANIWKESKRWRVTDFDPSSFSHP